MAEGRVQPTPRRRQEWMVVTGGPEAGFQCLRCGEHYVPRYPIPIDLWVGLSKAFRSTHRKCRARRP